MSKSLRCNLVTKDSLRDFDTRAHSSRTSSPSLVYICHKQSPNPSLISAARVSFMKLLSLLAALEIKEAGGDCKADGDGDGNNCDQNS